ncbi:hypothetical protein Pst134EB_021738 [Puccinia striiformis f. sp. tritici]|nr:hypothetical protein Pst134EB_021738 [Puccinia striiformis f. sp. tritici]
MLHLLTLKDSQLFDLSTGEDSQSGLIGVPAHGLPSSGARSMNRTAVLKRLHVQLVSYQFHHASKLLLAFQDVHGPLQQHEIDVLVTYRRLMMGALTQEFSRHLQPATNRFLGSYRRLQGVRYDPITRNTSNDDQNYAGEFRMMRREIQIPEQVRFTVTLAKIAAMDGIIEIARDDRDWTQGNPDAETELQAHCYWFDNILHTRLRNTYVFQLFISMYALFSRIFNYWL